MARRRRKSAQADVEKEVESLRSLLRAHESELRHQVFCDGLRVRIGDRFERAGRWGRAVREYGLALRAAKRRRGPRAAQLVAAMRLKIAALAARRYHRRRAMGFLVACRRGLLPQLRRWPDADGLVEQYGEAVRRIADLRSDYPDFEHFVAVRTLESLVRYFDAFVRRNPGSLAGQRQVAESCMALSDALENVFEDEEALPHQERAASIYRALLEIAPEDGVRRALSFVLHEIGKKAVLRKAWVEAKRLLDEALGLLLATDDLGIALAEDPLSLAKHYEWIGHAVAGRGDVEASRAAFLRSFAALEAAGRRGVEGRRRRREWGELFSESCLITCRELLVLGPDAEAPPLLGRAKRLLRDLAERRYITPTRALQCGRWLEERAAEA